MNEVLNSVQDMQSAPVEKEAPLQDRVKVEIQGPSRPSIPGKSEMPTATPTNVVGEQDHASNIAENLLHRVGNNPSNPNVDANSGILNNLGNTTNYDTAPRDDKSAASAIETQNTVRGVTTTSASWDSKMNMDNQYKATDTEDYSWNKLASQRSQAVYEQERAQVLADYSKSMQEIRAAGAQAMEEYLAATYSANQTADKMGWSGGHIESEAARTKFLQAQTKANMFNKFELQEYGLNSQLSVARMYAEAERDKLALEMYQDAENLALQKADRTGFYISPEAGEMMIQMELADKIANDPNATQEQKDRAENIRGAVYAYFDSLGFEKSYTDPRTGKTVEYPGVKTLATYEYEETVYMNKVQEQYQKDMLTEQQRAADAAEDSANAAWAEANSVINFNKNSIYSENLKNNGELIYNGKTYPSMIRDKNGNYQGVTGGAIKTYNGSTYLKTDDGQIYVWSANKKSDYIPGYWVGTSTKVPDGDWTAVNRTYTGTPKTDTGKGNGDGDGDKE